MTTQHPLIMQDEHTRKCVEPELTVGDLCMDAMSCMMAHEDDEQRFTVLSGGVLYFFDVKCVGIKPPYEVQEPELGSGETTWFGQREN